MPESRRILRQPRSFGCCLALFSFNFAPCNLVAYICQEIVIADAGLRTHPHYFCSIRELLIVDCILDLQQPILPVASAVAYKFAKINLAN